MSLKGISTRFLESLEVNGCFTVIIIDHVFWVNNEEELARWLIDNTESGLNTREGMVLNFKTREEMMWFMLKWN